MEDAYDPTEAELRAWAYGQDFMEPVQDFDLMVATESRAELLFEFASDSNCQTKDYFLHCLYLLVGDAVRSKYRTTKKKTIERIVKQGKESTSDIVLRWSKRSENLVKHPESFSYERWCGGGLAYERTSG
jgi:hypothetical protein